MRERGRRKGAVISLLAASELRSATTHRHVSCHKTKHTSKAINTIYKVDNPSNGQLNTKNTSVEYKYNKMISPTTSKALSKLLTSPSKVAHSLDWKKVSGSVLSMSITRDRIHLAIANHPTDGPTGRTDKAQSLPSIPIETEVLDKQRRLSPKVAAELKTILRDFEVCGLVVAWPVQQQGWAGAACGRTLFTLDELLKDKALNCSRPVCLWDEEHHAASFEDEWGRSPLYGEPPSADKTVHVASEEQYNTSTKTDGHVASDIWNDFCRAHWPELYLSQQQQKRQPAWSISAPPTSETVRTASATSSSTAPTVKFDVAETDFSWLEENSSKNKATLL